MDELATIQPGETPRAIGTSIYNWMFSAGSCPQTVADIASACLPNGITQIKCKVLDGTDWMGTFDRVWNPRKKRSEPHPLSFQSSADVATRKAEFEAVGMSFIPWTVPRGFDLNAEKGMLFDLNDHGLDTIELDVEPYKGFFETDFSALPAYIQALALGGINVWVDAHISWYTVQQLPLEEMAGWVNCWWSQSYWTTFKASPKDTIEYEAGVFNRINAMAWGSIFPTDGWSQFDEAINAVRDNGGIAASLWSINQCNRDILKAFGGVL